MAAVAAPQAMSWADKLRAASGGNHKGSTGLANASSGAAVVSPSNGKSNSGIAEQEIAALRKQCRDLQDELSLAAKWCEEQEQEHAEEEAARIEELDELLQTVEEAESVADEVEARSRKAQPQAAAARAARKRLQASKSEAEDKAAAAQQEAEQAIDKAAATRAAAKSAEERAAAVEATLAEVKEKLDANKAELEAAAEWVQQKEGELKAQLAAKEEELTRVTEALTCADAPASDEAMQQLRARAAKAQADGPSIQADIKVIKALCLANQQRAEEATKRIAEVKEAAAAAQARDAEEAHQSEEKCRDLQRHVETANRELKSCRAQAKASASQPRRTDDVSAEAEASRAAQRRVEEQTSRARSELERLRAQKAEGARQEEVEDSRADVGGEVTDEQEAEEQEEDVASPEPASAVEDQNKGLKPNGVRKREGKKAKGGRSTPSIDSKGRTSVNKEGLTGLVRSIGKMEIASLILIVVMAVQVALLVSRHL